MDRQDLEHVPARPTLGEELRSSALLFALAVAVTAGLAALVTVTLHLVA